MPSELQSGDVGAAVTLLAARESFFKRLERETHLLAGRFARSVQDLGACDALYAALKAYNPTTCGRGHIRDLRTRRSM